MWASCFRNSDYELAYQEYEQLVDGYGWSLFEMKKMTIRERRHWVNRYLHKLEQEYQRQHRANNSAQTIIGNAMGGAVTFGGHRLR